MKTKKVKKEDVNKLRNFLYFKKDKEEVFNRFVKNNPPYLMVKGSRVYGMFLEMLKDQKKLIEEEQELTEKAYGKIQISKREDLKEEIKK